MTKEQMSIVLKTLTEALNDQLNDIYEANEKIEESEGEAQ